MDLEPYKTYGRGPYSRNMNQYNRDSRQTQTRRDNSSCNSCNRTNQMPVSNSGCNDNNSKMRSMPLAMGYVPMQSWGELYDPETALCEGTAFPDLNLIFCGVRGKM